MEEAEIDLITNVVKSSVNVFRLGLDPVASSNVNCGSVVDEERGWPIDGLKNVEKKLAHPRCKLGPFTCSHVFGFSGRQRYYRLSTRLP